MAAISSALTDFNFESIPHESDVERRRELRDFLVRCRARVKPSHFDLPATGRRRVEGLRRDEVAELMGVSADWYRWLESGRPVRLAPQTLARLARALKLTPQEEVRLFELALAELYHAVSRSTAFRLKAS